MISKTEIAYFNAAKAVSKLSNHKHKLGCIVVNKHRIISSGYNSMDKFHRLQAQLDKEVFTNSECLGPKHAEFSALLPLMYPSCDLSKATIFIYREHKDGSPALARPCSRCMKLIKNLNIKKIKYTTEDGYAVEYIKED